MNKLIISLLAVLASATMAGQNFVGSWELFPSYGTPTKTIETPEYVYTLAGTSLCAYDKSTSEISALNSSNRLNANKVTNIWYNPDSKYLFVAYNDYNIDLVYDDGRIISVPDLRDAAITESKTINDVAFAGDKAFVALASGMIIIDAPHGAIVESALWGTNISRIAASDKKIMLYRKSGGSGLYIGSQAGSHHDFAKSFSLVNTNSEPRLMRLNGEKILAAWSTKAEIFTLRNDEVNNSQAYWSSVVTGHPGVPSIDLVPTRNGVLSVNGSKLIYVPVNGDAVTVTVAAANGKRVADWNGTAEKIWIADATGMGQYDVADAQFTISPAKPRGTSGSNVGRIIQHPNGNFYISTAEVHQAIAELAYPKQTYADVYNSSTRIFEPITSSLMSNSLSAFYVNPYDETQLFVGRFRTTAFIIDLKSGKSRTLNPKAISTFTTSSVNGWHVDANGNLWICLRGFDPRDGVDIVKAPKGSWETELLTDKWSCLPLPENLTTNHSTRMFVDESKGVIVVTGQTGFVAVQMPEADKSLSNACKTAFISNTSDSDGATMSFWKYPTIVTDKNGWLWIGTDGGVVYTKDSRDMFNPGFTMTRPKIARNDGTNLADYLLNQVEVISIAVDENNQKWIATLGSGLYRVKEDGTEIIEHLTVDNSDIPSNDVIAVCPDRNNNDVYVGTSEGLSIYHSTTSPGAEDYDDVYAYPNPVLPDYTGHITITGLKANSLVKIADASGNVFFEARSDGGMVVWNGCDASGRRVRSGVYFVFASEAGEGGSDAAVTKIVVIN